MLTQAHCMFKVKFQDFKIITTSDNSVQQLDIHNKNDLTITKTVLLNNNINNKSYNKNADFILSCALTLSMHKYQNIKNS